jgi:hypothetical protein
LNIFDLIFFLIVLIISLGPPFILYHWKVRKSKIDSRKTFTYLSGPALTLVLSVISINLAFFFFSRFIENAELSSFTHDFYMHIYWIFAPIFLLIYCYVDMKLIKRNEN